MKKSLIALATLAAATGAFAQSPNARAIAGSNVEIFGVIDMTLARHTGDKMGSQTAMIGDGRNESSRLGFRGMEDMGGGWGAGFWLEAGAFFGSGAGQNTTANKTAAGDKVLFGSAAATPYAPSATLSPRQGLTFNRASTVSLINKDIGEFRLGRDYVSTFWNYTGFDPFGTVGSGSAMLVQGGNLAVFGAQLPPGVAYPLVRTSNAVSWLSNDINGLRIQLQTGLSEQISGCTRANGNDYLAGNAQTGNTCLGAAGDGKLTSGRVSYTAGPLMVAAATMKTVYADVDAKAADGTVAAGNAQTASYKGTLTVNNYGAAYQLSPAVKLLASMGSQERTATLGNVERKLTHNMIGATYTTGALTYKFSLNNGKRSDGSVLSNGTGATSIDGAKQKQTAIGVVYDMSKRTALYGTYATATTTQGTGSATGIGALSGFNGIFGQNLTAAGSSSKTTGLDLGVRHRF